MDCFDVEYIYGFVMLGVLREHKRLLVEVIIEVAGYI